MGRPRGRKTTDNGKDLYIAEGQAMANYDSYEDSAKDLKLWLDQWTSNPFPSSVKNAYEYADQLKGANKGRANYMADTVHNYSTGIQRFL